MSFPPREAETDAEQESGRSEPARLELGSPARTSRLGPATWAVPVCVTPEPTAAHVSAMNSLLDPDVPGAPQGQSWQKRLKRLRPLSKTAHAVGHCPYPCALGRHGCLASSSEHLGCALLHSRTDPHPVLEGQC